MKTPRQLSSGINTIIIVVIILITLGAVMVANYRFVEQNPGGNDFLPRWVGTRAFIFDGLSPYSDTVARRIQTFAYGQPAQSGQDEMRMAYPLYSVLIFAPFALIEDFIIARALWMTLLELSVFIIAVFSLRLTDWRPKLWLLISYFLFSLIWYHSARSIINGNVVVIVALLFVSALLAIRNERDDVAGILLALSTIKPQVGILLIPFILIWALSIRRWKLITWTLSSVIILVILGVIFIPDWLLQNIREIISYPNYTPPTTIRSVLTLWMPGIGDKLGWILTVGLSVVLVGEWFAALKKDYSWFLWTCLLTLTISQWIGITTDPGNFIVLFPALVLTFMNLNTRWGNTGQFIVLICLIILFIGLWALFLSTIDIQGQRQQDPIMFIPLPLFLFLGLYWVRWWSISPSKLLVNR